MHIHVLDFADKYRRDNYWMTMKRYCRDFETYQLKCILFPLLIFSPSILSVSIHLVCSFQNSYVHVYYNRPAGRTTCSVHVKDRLHAGALR